MSAENPYLSQLKKVYKKPVETSPFAKSDPFARPTVTPVRIAAQLSGEPLVDISYFDDDPEFNAEDAQYAVMDLLENNDWFWIGHIDYAPQKNDGDIQVSISRREDTSSLRSMINKKSLVIKSFPEKEQLKKYVKSQRGHMPNWKKKGIIVMNGSNEPELQAVDLHIQMWALSGELFHAEKTQEYIQLFDPQIQAMLRDYDLMHAAIVSRMRVFQQLYPEVIPSLEPYKDDILYSFIPQHDELDLESL